jgi:hypothetical protein
MEAIQVQNRVILLDRPSTIEGGKNMRISVRRLGNVDAKIEVHSMVNKDYLTVHINKLLDGEMIDAYTTERELFNTLNP